MISSAGVKGKENPIEALKALIVDVLSQCPGDPFKPEEVADALKKPRVMVNRALSALSQDKKTKIKYITDGDGGYTYFGKPVIVNNIDYPSSADVIDSDTSDAKNSDGEDESVGDLEINGHDENNLIQSSSAKQFNKGVIISSIAKLYENGAKYLSDKQIIAAIEISPEIFSLAQMEMEGLGAIKSFEMPDFEDRMFKKTSTTLSFIDYEDGGVWLESSNLQLGEASSESSSYDEDLQAPKKRGRKPGPKLEKIPKKRGRKPKALVGSIENSGDGHSSEFVGKMASVSNLKVAKDHDIDKAILDFLSVENVASLDAISTDVIAKAKVSGRVNTRRIKVSVERLVLNGVLSHNYGENGFEYRIADKQVDSPNFSFINPSFDDFHQDGLVNGDGIESNSEGLVSASAVAESNLEFDFGSNGYSKENVESLDVSEIVGISDVDSVDNVDLLDGFEISENISAESRNVITMLTSSIINGGDVVGALNGIVSLISNLEASNKKLGGERQEVLLNLKKMIDRELGEI